MLDKSKKRRYYATVEEKAEWERLARETEKSYIELRDEWMGFRVQDLTQEELAFVLEEARQERIAKDIKPVSLLEFQAQHPEIMQMTHEEVFAAIRARRKGR